MDMLVNLDITPGLPAGEKAIETAGVWATMEDREYVVEDMLPDAVDHMTETLNGTHVNEVDIGKMEDSDDATGRRAVSPTLRGTFVACLQASATGRHEAMLPTSPRARGGHSDGLQCIAVASCTVL